MGWKYIYTKPCGGELGGPHPFISEKIFPMLGMFILLLRQYIVYLGVVLE